MASAERELLAAPAEVWGFLEQPHHLADWWPGIVAVDPDRRGFAVGARWRVVRRGRRGLPLLPAGGWQGRAREETLVIGGLWPGRRWEWQLVGQAAGARIAGPVRVAVELAGTRPGRTRVSVEVESRAWGADDRLIARSAVDRLYALVQTAAEL